METEKTAKPQKGKGRNFAYFKKSIDLADFIKSKQTIGISTFEEHKDSTKANPKFKKFDTDGNHIDTIGVFYGDDGNFYVKSWDVAYTDSAKNIYDFLIQEMELQGEPNSLKKVHKYLMDLEDKKEIYTVTPSQKKLLKKKDANSRKRFLADRKIKPFKDKNYLKSRGLSSQVLAIKTVEKNIKNIPFYFKPLKKEIDNTAFLMKGANGYTCYSMRNKVSYIEKTHDDYGIQIPKDKQVTKETNFKGFSYDVSDSLFTTYIDKKALEQPEIEKDLKDVDQLDNLCVFESAIDALSYYQLNQYDCQKENALYTSFEGTPGSLQYLTLSKLINHYKPKQVNLCFDNDTTGKKYALETMLNPDNIQSMKNTGMFKEDSVISMLNFKPTAVDNPRVYMKFHVSIEPTQVKDLTVAEIAGKLNGEFNEIKDYLSEFGIGKIELTFKLIKEDPVQLGAELILKKEDAILVAERLAESQFKENKIVMSIPENKDWNADLTESLEEKKEQAKEQEKVVKKQKSIGL